MLNHTVVQGERHVDNQIGHLHLQLIPLLLFKKFLGTKLSPHMLISVNRLHLMNLAESCSPVGNGRWYHFRECGVNGACKKVLDDLKLIKCLLNTIGYIGHCAQYSGEGNGTPLQYSCLENPMDGGAWWAAIHGVAEGWTRLSDFTFTFQFRALKKEMATHSNDLA